MNANPRAGPADHHFLSGGGEAGANLRAVDWGATPLGDPGSWPQSLKTIVRVMLDSRYAMWMLWGPELTFFCNDAYLPTLGLKREQAMGRRSDKVWAEIWADVWPRISKVLEKGEATWDDGLLLYLERSGFPEETYHTFSYSPVYDDDNRIAGMLCVVTEITERVLGERGLGVLRDLAARSAGSQQVRQTCEELVAVLRDDPLDVPFACLYVIEHTGARAWLAASCGSIPASLTPEAVALPGKDAAWPIGEVAQTGEARVLDLPGGAQTIPTPLWPDPVTRAVVLPVKGPSAGTAAAVLIAGVSPRRLFDAPYQRFYELVAAQFSAALNAAHAYEAERARAEGLAALDRAKMQFFSNVSHEFRTPLTLLLGPIEELLGDPRTPPPVRQQLTLAHRNSLRLLKLVNSLLDFSRIESGRVQASYEPTDLAQLTRDLASNFRSAIERAGLRLDVDCPPVGAPVYVDRDMWEKVVLNLLSNAFKHTLAGSISVHQRRERDEVVLEVSDTGVGVPAEAIPRLFDRFFRVEGSQGRTQEGSGIGLALVQELVKLHSGTIDVQSELGKGSRFEVRLPLGSAHLPADRIKAPRALATTAIGAQAFVQEALRWVPDADGSELAGLPEAGMVAEDRRFASTFGARILLADDNTDMRMYVTELLSPCYRIESVADGREAMEAAVRLRPDLVVSDVMMPRLDGFGLLKEVREHEALRGVPVILLSARAGEEARIEGLDAGADDYLVKPFSARELLARVGSILERERLHRETLEQERRAQDEFRLRMTQLEVADRQKDEFLAMLAHELRNPLAPIHNAGELLARTLPPDPRAEAAIGIVKRQVGHLTRLVDDLLDVSRITQGRVELRRRPVHLSEVVAQAVETVEALFRDKQHRVTVTSGYEALQVYGDPARLVQCVENILTNAAKYTDARGEIHIASHAVDGEAVLSVTDNGAGIAPELLPRVFDLFVQSQRTLDRAQGGLGIGLCVVKRLIEMHGGAVIARSEGLGRGCTFEIRLPLVAHGHVHASDTPVPEVPPKRILVVDDNKDVAESLAMLLRLEKHEVVATYAPRSAMELYATFQPDVVLLDIGLPEIDGYELARRLLELPGLPRVRFIALTGYGQAEDRQRAHEAGFHAHLVKPVDLDTLQRTIAR